jgi:hypothetical protein
MTGAGSIPASRNRSHASRTIPPVEVGINDKLLEKLTFRILRKTSLPTTNIERYPDRNLT